MAKQPREQQAAGKGQTAQREAPLAKGRRPPAAHDEWVEERTLGAGAARFRWRVDAEGNLAMRRGKDTLVFERAGLERLQGFMGDGAWHPATRHTEAALAGKVGRSIEDFGRSVVGWPRRHGESAGHLGAVFTNAGTWEWNSRLRGVMFRQVERSLERVRRYYQRRRRGERQPSRQGARETLRREYCKRPHFDVVAAFRAASQQLRARLAHCDAGGRHPTEKGQRREAPLREFLRDRLQGRYAVTRGEVMSYIGSASRQMDVLIYHPSPSSVLLRTDASLLLTAESVYAAIEVKPHLDAAALEQAAANLCSVKVLPRHGVLRTPLCGLGPQPTENPVPFGAVFAYESEEPARLLETLRACQEHLPPTLWVDCVCVLDRAVIYRRGVMPGPAGWHPSLAAERTLLVCEENGPHSLLTFYLLLVRDLESKTMAPPDLLWYLLGSGGSRPPR